MSKMRPLLKPLAIIVVLSTTAMILILQNYVSQSSRSLEEALFSPQSGIANGNASHKERDESVETTTLQMKKVEIAADVWLTIPVLQSNDTMGLSKEVNETKTKTNTNYQGSGEDDAKPTKPLNILILYPDDWRHDSLGSAGTQPVLTPFLDSLARQGIRFTHNCVTTSICWVSRATLFTGQYLSRHKSKLPHEPVFYNYWNQTWPHLLQEAGYFTGHIGKWQYSNYSWVREQYNWTQLHEGYHWYKGKGPDGGTIHASDLAMGEAIQFLQRDRPRDRPFALTVAFYPPKAVGEGPEQYFPKNETKKLYENITIPEPYNWNASHHRLPNFLQNSNEGRVRWRQRFSTAEAYQNSMRNYYALITEVDKACERIVGELREQGILNETLIIFTTDNGYFHGEHGLAGKWYPYQESIRVPLIIRDPRMPESKRGQLDNSFTLNVDLASTVMGAAQLKKPSVMQGRDIADLYLLPNGQTTWRKEFYYEHMSMGKTYIPASSALVRKDFKYFSYSEWNVEQLFDLRNDPFENNDLSNQTEYAALIQAMRKRHDELKLDVI